MADALPSQDRHVAEYRHDQTPALWRDNGDGASVEDRDTHSSADHGAPSPWCSVTGSLGVGRMRAVSRPSRRTMSRRRCLVAWTASVVGGSEFGGSTSQGVRHGGDVATTRLGRFRYAGTHGSAPCGKPSGHTSVTPVFAGDAMTGRCMGQSVWSQRRDWESLVQSRGGRNVRKAG